MATDGRAGEISDIYCNDMNWMIRFLLVRRGWLSREPLLVSPTAIERIDRERPALITHYSHGDLEKESELHQKGAVPVSKQPPLPKPKPKPAPSPEGDETAEALPPPSIPPDWSGFGPYLFPETLGIERENILEKYAARVGDRHLRSGSALIGMEAVVDDERVGRIHDLRIESDRWWVASLVIEKGVILHGERFAVSTRDIEEIDCATAQITLRPNAMR